MLTDDERRGLLRYARHVIAAHLHGDSPPPPPAVGEPLRHAGAFVTLHAAGDLRGCIGYPGSQKPIDEVVAECAVASATEDPRFPPVHPSELPALSVEISVLTPIEPVRDLRDIEVGRDGLVVEQGFRRGLLLPQVATEHGWNRETFLAHTCMKAGLRPDAWRGAARVSRFQAEVFGEDEAVPR
ncbi:MAG: AmmeMemoRadiSam system protein A [Acidobacteria bacterium]|nr:MAG: AmmeMemoRadiSam system protein A [Acidobacteriota bacterium]